jgi:protein O-GlcNAc transferase
MDVTIMGSTGDCLRLLFACAQVPLTESGKIAIREILAEDVDWTVFARKALGHGLAGLAGHNLAQAAPDLVPGDIFDALRMTLEQARRKNRALFDELGGVLEALAKAGIEAIPFKGPVLALETYGDLGLRVFSDLDFLVRDCDLPSAMTVLAGLGYARKETLRAPQIAMIQHLQGQDFLYKKSAGIGVEPHTRLTPIKMALNIDYAGLWQRAQPRRLNGRKLLMLAPEDDLIVLAIHGGKEMWWNIKWACDVAAFVGAHAKLDWAAVLERARLQGCLRMVLLATSLAREHFHAATPGAVRAAERADAVIPALVERITAHWQADAPMGPPSNKTLSLDRLRLHDGFARRARYVARTLFLPGPHHIAAMPLPSGLGFAYVPLAIAHDLIALPLWRVYRGTRGQAKRLRGALATSDLALALMPATADTKRRINAHQKARAEAERGLAADPNNAGSWYSLGNALFGLGRYGEALACYDRALEIVPDSTAIWAARARAVRAGKKTDSVDIEDERTLDPQDAGAWARRGGFLLASQRFGEAAAASDRALAIDPKHLGAIRIGIRSRASACDWHQWEEDKRRISEGVRAGQHIITPFNHRALCDSEEEHFLVARLYWKGTPQPEPLWKGQTYRHDRIRIAYLSAELHDHPLAVQIVGVFEHHDRTRFETTAISLGPANRSAMRRRVQAGVERFIDARALNDAEIASMMRELEVDIAVDLNGHAGAGRPGILAHRPAPVQLTCLAYTGTMGAPFIDYIMADRIVIPSEQFGHYTEKVVHLPNSYQCNDSQRAVPERIPSRADAGLPETGFVFCCFNNTHKITPPIFDVWMRLLTACPGSVLWLLGDNPYAMHNLRREAAARGVAPERLVFGPRVSMDEHLARHRLANLFLDTLPYNAHATGADALWAGLPLLTCRGRAFPGLVGASMLCAVGLPELVTSSLAEYEELALALARDPERLAAIKSKLMRNRGTEPLFDTAQFTRDLESAYATMWERQRAALPPASFAVPG